MATYVGGQVAGRAGNVSSTTVNFALTGGLYASPLEGDLVVITSVVGSQGRTPAQAISGYTPLGQLNANGTTYDTSLDVSYKVMGPTPDTSFTLPATGHVDDAQRYTVQVWRGVDVSGITSASATGTATGRPDAPSITPTVAGSVVLLCGGGAAATGASYTAPTNFTTNFLTGATADTNDAMVGSGYWAGWTSGAVNPAAYTGGTTNAADSWAIYSIVLPPVARDPLTYKDEEHGNDSTFGVSSVIATPPTVAVGDLEVIWVAAAAIAPTAAPTISTPAGWRPGGSSGSVPLVGGAVNTRVSLFWRISPDTGSNATLSAGVNSAFVWGRLSYEDPDPIWAFRQVVFGNDTGGDTSVVVSSLNAFENSLLNAFLSQGASQTLTAPGSMTERFDSSAGGLASADETASATGATGTRTFTLAATADAAWGFAEFFGVAVSPGGGPTGSLNATETGSDTLSSGGAVLVQGSAASTESGSDTFEASDGKLYLVGLTTAPAEPATSIDEKTTLAPTGVKAGHREVIFCAVGSLAPAAAPVIEALDGWTMDGQSDGTHVIGEGVFNLRMAAFSRIADGPASNATVSSTTPGYWGWHRFALANPNADFAAKVIFGDLASTTTSPVLPGFTPAKTHAMRIDWHVLGDLVGISPAAGMTEWSENTDHGLGLYSQQLADTTPTGTRTYTYASAADAGYITLEFHSLVSQVVIAGSLAVTESGSDTAVIIGGQVATGSLNATEAGSDTGSLVGAVLVQGSLSAAEAGSDTASIAGQALVQGSLVTAEAGADTAAVSGVVLVQGLLNVTESGSDVFAASGSLSGGINGALNATESGSDTLVSSGLVVVSGVLTASEVGTDSAVISGAVLVQGALTVSETGSDSFSASGTASIRTGMLDAVEDGSDTAQILGDGVTPVAGSSLGFELVDHESKSWWKRKPKSLPEAVANKKIKQVAKAIDEIAAEKIEQDEPIKQRDVREELAPLLAEMPGFDWRPLFRAVVEYRQQEAARLEAMAQIERIRAIERDDDDVLALLMSF